MRAIILNGSPKGENSVTYHNALYLEKHFPEVEFEYLHVGKYIKKYEKNLEFFEEIRESIKNADLIVWLYPVYFTQVPYQLMRFIDLIIERGYSSIFKDKYTTQMLTSKRFYDITAYNYVHQIVEDFEMKHITGNTLDMNDLLNEEGREYLLDFFKATLDIVKNKKLVTKKYYKIKNNSIDYKYNSSIESKGKKESSIVIVYDGKNYSNNLKNMINSLEDKCNYLIHKLDISNIDIRGGCLGCLKCAFSETCVYKDDFEQVHKEKVIGADIVLYASDITNHWMDVDLKKYLDRTFYNGHRITMAGSATGYILSGPLRQEHNLRDVLEARADVGHLYLLDIVTDEDNNTDDKLSALSEQIDYFMDNRPKRSRSFWGIAGMKVFRDLVYDMKYFLVEDHSFYKKNKLYDFPKKHFLLSILLYFPVRLMRKPKVFRKVSPKLLYYMTKNYKKAIEKH